MATDKKVAIRLSVKDGELVRATLERLGKDGEAAIKKIDKAAKDSGGHGGGVSLLDSGIAKLKTGMAGLAAGFTVGAIANFVRDMANIGSEMAALQARVGNISGQFERSREVFLDVMRAAQNVGVGVGTAADAFSRLSLAARDLGVTSTQVTQVTETVLKLGRIGGSSMQDVANATVQLGQALASGRLQGDELRSILENMPLVGRAIAKEFGVTVGALRQLGADGELSADRIFRALIAAAGEADREFAKLPATMEQSGARAANGWKLLAAALDDSLGISKLLGAALEGIGAHAAVVAGRISGDLTQQIIDARTELEKIGRVGGSRAVGTVQQPDGSLKPIYDRAGDARAEGIRDQLNLLMLLEGARNRDRRTDESDKALDAKWVAQARAAKEAAAAVDELVQKYDAGAAKSAKVAAAQDVLTKAVATGGKTQAEADEILKAYAASLEKADPAAKKLATAQDKIHKAVADSIATMEQEIHLLGLSEEERFVQAKVIDLQRRALEAKDPLEQAEIARLEETARTLYQVTKARDADKKATEDAAREAKRAREEFKREAEKQAEEQRELLLEPYREAWRSIQQLGADAIEQLFDGGLKNAKDFWKSFLDIAKKALIQIASAEITVAIQGVFSTSGAPGGQGGISGLLGQIFGGGSSPLAGTGNLPSNGGGGIGGLFGSNSIGSFLSRPLSSVFGSSGAASGYNTGMLFPGESALQGVSYAGGYFDSLSLGQGLGFLGGAAGGIAQIVQGGTANMIGGITSLVGAGVSLIPGVGQILGPLLSVAGPIIGSLFGKKPKKFPKSRFRLLTTGGDDSLFEPGGSPTVTSPFGTIGYHSDGSNERFIESDAAGPYLQTLADIDNAIADLLTPEQIAMVSAALNGVGGRRESFRDDPNGREFFAATEDRLASMLRALYGSDVASQGFSGIARSDENIEQLAERAVDIISLKNAIADFGKASTDAEDAVRAIQKQFAEMKADAEAWGFSDADIAAIEAERKRTLNALAGDINKNIADALLGYSDPYALAQQQLAEAQDTRRQEALYLIEQYEKGVLDTLVDINKLEELFGKERAALAEQALEAIGASWQGFVDELTFGPLSAKSNREQYNLALAEYDDVRARAQAAFAANDNLDPALAAEFQNEARLALQWSRTFNASSAATASLYQQILDLAGQFGDLDIPGFAGGGVAGPGLIEVGERGREFIRLFQPARVYSNGESNAMLGGNGQGIEKLTEMFEYMSRLFTGSQSQMMQRLGQLLEQFIAARRDAELRGATAAATTPPGPVGVSRIAARR